jgi:hypothetical protein
MVCSTGEFNYIIMQTRILKNRIEFNQAQSNEVALILKDFYSFVSYEEVEEITNELLESSVSEAKNVNLDIIEDRIFWVREIQSLLCKLNSLSHQSKKITND